jgi:23S rRNA (pseudouridine1915-N3)-methyltransferase
LQFKLIHPGSASRGPLDEAARDYLGRVRKRLRADEVFVRPSQREDVRSALAEEATRIEAVIGPRDLVVALDRGGAAWSSVALAEQLGAWREASPSAVCFVLGSAHGLDATFLTGVARRWSFGPLTLPHDLARVVLWEQVYRACAIREGSPYHK